MALFWALCYGFAWLWQVRRCAGEKEEEAWLKVS